MKRRTDDRHVARLHSPAVSGYLAVTGAGSAEAIVNVLRALAAGPSSASERRG